MTVDQKRNIPISLPDLGEQEYAALKETIMSGWVTQGPKVRAFETLFAGLHGAKHAYAVTSCTTGLQLILAGLGIGEGDEVIVPAFTWVASANVIEHCGATPVFIDIDTRTFNLDPAQLQDKITNKTKAIIAVHLFGLCADIAAIKDVAGDIPIIEDAACAVGSASPLGHAGSIGTAASFSFHPRKSVTTGEGGMVTTNDTALGERMDVLRNHGASISEEKRHLSARPYILPDFEVCGFNFRMTDIQATIGIVQLERLEEILGVRQKWAAYYQEQLADIDWLQVPVVAEGYTHGWQSFVCMVDEAKAPMSRNDIMDALQAVGISTRPGTHAVHMLGYYKDKYQISSDDFPGAKAADQQSIAIPLHNKMSPEDFEFVVEQLRSMA